MHVVGLDGVSIAAGEVEVFVLGLPLELDSLLDISPVGVTAGCDALVGVGTLPLLGFNVAFVLVVVGT